MFWIKALIAGFAAAVLTFSPTDARADTAACVTAHFNGQALEEKQDLAGALSAFRTCAARECPSVVRDECTTFLAELLAQYPRLHVQLANDEPGAAKVQVFIDGQPVGELPLADDFRIRSGHRVLTFERAGWQTTKIELDVPSRVLAVPVVVRFEREPTRSVGHEGLQPAAPTAESGGVPTATWVLGGIGVAAAASFAGFGLAANNVAGCAGSCTKPQVERVRSFYVVADLSLVTSLLSLGAGTYFYLYRPANKRGGQAAATLGLAGTSVAFTSSF